MGTLLLTCSQDFFMEHFLGALRDRIFNQAAVMIYVFDVSSKDVEVNVVLSIGGHGKV